MPNELRHSELVSELDALLGAAETWMAEIAAGTVAASRAADESLRAKRLQFLARLAHLFPLNASERTLLKAARAYRDRPDRKYDVVGGNHAAGLLLRLSAELTDGPDPEKETPHVTR